MVPALVFFAVLTAVFVACYRAPDPPQTHYTRQTRLAGIVVRIATSAFLTFLLGLLPALVAFALVGGTLA